MIVDLAHVPLNQRRADAPFNKLPESPLPEDPVELQMPDTATPDPSTDGDASASVFTQSPNHLPSDAPVPPENSGNPEGEPQWNQESELDNNRDTADETKDNADSSKSKPSASLPKLIIPPHDEKAARKRRQVMKCRYVFTQQMCREQFYS